MNAHTYSLTSRALAYVVAIAVAVAPLAVGTAHADGPRDEARNHYLKGKELFGARDYQGAIREFQEADRLAPSPVLQFNIGLAHEQLGQTDKALEHYRAYLALVPNAPNRDEVQARVEKLKKQQEAARKPAAPPAPDPAPAVAPRPAPAPGPAEQAPARPVPTGVPDEFGQTETSRRPGEAAPPPAPARPAQPAQPATGDPDVDRVAAMDVAAIRDQRSGQMVGAEPASAQADGSHAAFGTQGDAAKPQSKPAYKQWWFWVVVGVGAVILIDIVSSDSQRNAATGASSLQSPILLRF